MSLLNGFFYLMLLLAGLSTALILFDLKKREDEAYARLDALYARRQDPRSVQDRMAGPSMMGNRPARRPSVKRVIAIELDRTDSFFEVDGRNDWSRPAPMTAQVSYDFALPVKAPANQQVIGDQAAFHSETSCCA